jgi:glycosyltransferase involved in cell wall biosynthesis
MDIDPISTTDVDGYIVERRSVNGLRGVESRESTEQALFEAQLKIEELKQALNEQNHKIEAMQNSLSWRISGPMRWLLSQMQLLGRGTKWTIKNTQSGGIKNALRMGWMLYRNIGLSEIRKNYIQEVSRGAKDFLTPRVLIVAELSIPQCTKYRVLQKSEMFKSLGIDCTVDNWNDTQTCLDDLQTHTLVIFYRVPACPGILKMIKEARRLKVETIWEVDDLIFDRALLAASKALSRLDRQIFDQLLIGADQYRKAMLLCDSGLASTTGLAVAMRKAGLAQVRIVENALDKQTILIAENIHAQHLDVNIRIVYGSGTTTHDLDFEEAAPAIVAILATFPQVRFRLIGTLNLPSAFNAFESQLELLPFCGYEAYLRSLAECDISVAPLENYIFNDAKSNIKFLEASILKLPSVCSPRAAFAEVIVNGVNGYLCESNEEWKGALTQLVIDKAKRNEIGEAAYLTAIQFYTQQRISQLQVLPLLQDHHRTKDALRVLSVNCLYHPRSFGGATVVAEELNKRLNAYAGFEVSVFTALPSKAGEAYTIRRYEADGINVFGLVVPEVLNAVEQFQNPHCADPFASVLAAVKPDVVHFHSIQDLGVALLEVCTQMDIKYVVTLHDAWWLCGRQFMINKQGKFCGQDRIDLDVCSVCVENHRLNLYRSKRLSLALRGASTLLAPSHFFADFYRKNGFANVLVNKNGIVPPGSSKRYRKKGPLRFGYVGGNTSIKGFTLVKKVFSDLVHVKVRLVLVDNTLNLGFPAYGPQDLAGLVGVEVVLAYTQSTIDSFFSCIDVLLFPSQVKESFGLTVREALARNVWVIATDAGGLTEDIAPGNNGFIVPFMDRGEALTQAVLDTVAHFEEIQPGEVVELSATTITMFDDQAVELAAILKNVVG